jgi:hypothetical protein
MASVTSPADCVRGRSAAHSNRVDAAAARQASLPRALRICVKGGSTVSLTPIAARGNSLSNGNAERLIHRLI